MKKHDYNEGENFNFPSDDRFNPNNYESKLLYVEFDGIDGKDAPDFADAFICYAEYDGYPLTDDEMAMIDDSTVNELLHDYLY